MAIDINKPFADTGDKTVIPEAIQPDGGVSFDQGWGAFYELNPATDPSAKRLSRTNYNYLFNVLFSNQKELVKQGVNNHIIGKEYDANDKVRGVDGKNYISLEDANTDTPPSTKWKLDPNNSITITGTATFTNADNNINLTGVGNIGLEIGDVITVADSVSNNKVFTVEVNTDANNIIVNEAHAGGTTTKSLVGEVSTANVKINLLSKYYNAPIGLGQGWVNVASDRTIGVNETNISGRSIQVKASITTLESTVRNFIVDGETVQQSDGTTVGGYSLFDAIIPNNSAYNVSAGGIQIFEELR
jgi:hypothetical protein